MFKSFLFSVKKYSKHLEIFHTHRIINYFTGALHNHIFVLTSSFFAYSFVLKSKLIQSTNILQCLNDKIIIKNLVHVFFFHIFGEEVVKERISVHKMYVHYQIFGNFKLLYICDIYSFFYVFDNKVMLSDSYWSFQTISGSSRNKIKLCKCPYIITNVFKVHFYYHSVKKIFRMRLRLNL